jgi:glycosyltransferase involved in cell wall biosynthesis
VGRILAEELSELGHHVRVLTETPSAGEMDSLFPIVRRPSARELWRSLEWCDVCLHNNISLRAAWPFLFLQRPWLVTHHTWICRPNGTLSWRDRLKLQVLSRTTSIAISEAMASTLPVTSTTLNDPYDDTIFDLQPEVVRDRELVFVGRLVSDKGADLAIEALAALPFVGRPPVLTIVGDGPERTALQCLAAARGVSDRVKFVGPLIGHELATVLNQHQILVVPSRWNEPFGLVALEGIACGCVVVGSAGGGLPQAIGPCGVTVPNNDASALTAALADLMARPARLNSFRERASVHLSPYRRQQVGRAYEALLARTVARPAPTDPLTLPEQISLRRTA